MLNTDKLNNCLRPPSKYSLHNNNNEKAWGLRILLTLQGYPLVYWEHNEEKEEEEERIRLRERGYLRCSRRFEAFQGSMQ